MQQRPRLSLYTALGVLRAIVNTRESKDGQELPVGYIPDADWELVTSPGLGS